MKISKQRLLQILKEEMEAPAHKLKTKSVSGSAMRAADIERIKQTGDETTTQEAGILNQIENFLAKLAATPGVDLAQKRSVLERILKLLQQNVAGNAKGEQNAQMDATTCTSLQKRLLNRAGSAGKTIEEQQ